MRSSESESIQTPLRRQQLSFAAYIRNPGQPVSLGNIADERMVVYRELFFNNIQETLSSAFPVLQQVLQAGQWQALCQKFFAEHRCQTPYLNRVPQEFLNYLQQNNISEPPWLLELAQWEWTELELFLAPDSDITDAACTDVLDAVPILSPLARVHSFMYPVHQISKQFLPNARAQEIIHLLAWRKRDDRIGFMQLNALSARLLELVRKNLDSTVHQILLKIACEYSEYDAGIILQGGMDALQSFYDNAIVYMTTPGNIRRIA
jgi:uncharacterized protein